MNRKKKVQCLILTLAMLISIMSFSAFADTPKFRLEGKVVLPGSDVAPEGGLAVTLEYRSDSGTLDTTDDTISNYVIILQKDAHEASFSWDVPFTLVTDKSPKFTLTYTILPSTKYWDRGYYTLGGIQYYSNSQTHFPEGSVSGLVITPLRASEISGWVCLPSYSVTQAAVEVSVSAKTAGTLPDANDDYEARTRVTLTGSAIAYKLRVPAITSSAAYLVSYETNTSEYEKQGWYNVTGTAITSSAATRVDVSGGNRSDINLVLVKKILPPVPPPVPTTPAAISFDLNGDKKVDVKDQVLVAQAMGSKKKYSPAFDLNKDGVIDVRDLMLIKAEIEKAKTHFQPTVNPVVEPIQKVKSDKGNGNGKGKGK
ncbi:MAG: dockerin type I domain-containing protein [Clostridia bacterium]|nr:dockerin type I domain-containing protein [Clostridia bacterium]